MNQILRFGFGLIVLGLSMVVIVYFLWFCLKRSEDPVKLIVKGVVTLFVIGLILSILRAGPVGVIFTPVLGVVLAVIWAPQIGALMASPFTTAFDGGNEAESAPLYSIAEAKRKRGHYLEAIQAVSEQLESFPGDFQGEYLIAEIQAQNLHDLPAATETINAILGEPDHQPKNLVFALTRLADWQIQAGQIELAQETFDRIIERFPDTDEAQMAEQRKAHLGNASRPDAVSRDAVRAPIPLPHYTENVGLQPGFTGLKGPVEDPAVLAERYVKQLEHYPLDSETREKLALLYYDQYRRFDLAAAELEQLIEHPHQPPKQVARWLNLLADLQLKETGNIEQPFDTLQRIIDLYPNSAAAETALHRQRYLNIELKGQQSREPIKVPPTDQRLGLR